MAAGPSWDKVGGRTVTRAPSCQEFTFGSSPVFCADIPRGNAQGTCLKSEVFPVFLAHLGLSPTLWLEEGGCEFSVP